MTDFSVPKTTSWQSRLLNLIFWLISRPTYVMRPWMAPLMRWNLNLYALLLWLILPVGVRVKRVKVRGLTCEWVTPDEVTHPGTILFFHGGGYAVCSPRTHRTLTFALAKRTGCRVFSATYRQMPEHVCPAALEDAEAIYDWLQDQGEAPDQITLSGDSSGGGLCLALTQSLIAKGQQSPAKMVLFSPFTDMSGSGASVEENAQTEPMFTRRVYDLVRRIYPRDLTPDDPRHSPLFGSTTGFPPTLIFNSTIEMVRDDGLRMAAKIEQTGGQATALLYPGQIHVWPAFLPILPEANRAMDQAAGFILSKTSREA